MSTRVRRTALAPGLFQVRRCFPGFRPSNEVDTGRHSIAAYADLEADVLDRVRLGLAGRVEHYSDFGSTADGKVTARVKLHPRAVARGAVSTGFRAPALAQSYLLSDQYELSGCRRSARPIRGWYLPRGQPAGARPGRRGAQARGIRSRERRRRCSNPTDALEVTADLYRVDIDDRIVISGNFTGGRISELSVAARGDGGAVLYERHRYEDDRPRPQRELPHPSRHGGGSASVGCVQHDGQRHPSGRRHARAAGRPRAGAVRPDRTPPRRVRATAQQLPDRGSVEPPRAVG